MWERGPTINRLRCRGSSVAFATAYLGQAKKKNFGDGGMSWWVS